MSLGSLLSLVLVLSGPEGHSGLVVADAGADEDLGGNVDQGELLRRQPRPLAQEIAGDKEGRS